MRAAEAQGPGEFALLWGQVTSCGCSITQRELPSGQSEHTGVLDSFQRHLYLGLVLTLSGKLTA